ncbi:unnamed protein product [Gadus morhua 'NCC']
MLIRTPQLGNPVHSNAALDKAMISKPATNSQPPSSAIPYRPHTSSQTDTDEARPRVVPPSPRESRCRRAEPFPHPRLSVSEAQSQRTAVIHGQVAATAVRSSPAPLVPGPTGGGPCRAPASAPPAPVPFSDEPGSTYLRDARIMHSGGLRGAERGRPCGVVTVGHHRQTPGHALEDRMITVFRWLSLETTGPPGDFKKAWYSELRSVTTTTTTIRLSPYSSTMDSMKPGLTKFSETRYPERKGIGNALGSAGTEVLPAVIALALGTRRGRGRRRSGVSLSACTSPLMGRAGQRHRGERGRRLQRQKAPPETRLQSPAGGPLPTICNSNVEAWVCVSAGMWRSQVRVYRWLQGPARRWRSC